MPLTIITSQKHDLKDDKKVYGKILFVRKG